MLFEELNEAVQAFHNDATTGAVVLTGSEKAFAGTTSKGSALTENCD